MTNPWAVTRKEAQTVLGLLASRQEWIHRRIETLELTSDGNTRRSISIDLSLEELIIRGLRILPISRIEKRVFKNFDIRSSSDESLSVLTQEQTRVVVMAVLRLGLDAEYLENSDEYLRHIIDYDFQGHDSEVQFNSTFKPAWGFLLIYYNRLDKSDRSLVNLLMEIAVDLINGNILFVQVPESTKTGNRTVLKYSYDDPFEIQGLARPKIIIQPLLTTWSNTLHLEMRTPRQIVIKELAIRDLNVHSNLTAPLIEESTTDKSARQISHVVLETAPPDKRFATAILLRAESRGLPTIAFLALSITCLVTIELFTSGFPKAFRPGFIDGKWVNGNTTTTTTILLLVPSFLFTYIARESAHNIEARILNYPRRALLLSGLWMFMAAIVNIHSKSEKIFGVITHDDLATMSGVLLVLYGFWFWGATNIDAKVQKRINQLRHVVYRLQLKFFHRGIKPVYFAVYKNVVVSARGKRNRKYPPP